LESAEAQRKFQLENLELESNFAEKFHYSKNLGHCHNNTQNKRFLQTKTAAQMGDGFL
jgi:hypothetical protein